MGILQDKFLEATKNILQNNLELIKFPYKENKLVLVYDLNSPLSRELSNAYLKNLETIEHSEAINFDEIEADALKEKLLSLEKNSTVVLVQSTNFRLESFRIRLSLHNNLVGCLEHNHLKYIKDDEIENYADVIEYRTPYFDRLSNTLKDISDNADTIKVECSDGSVMSFSGGFEDMKQNTGNYSLMENRGGTFPIGENFTEILDFSKANGELSVYAYPGHDLQVKFVAEPFKIKVENSLVTCDDDNAPEEFLEVLEKINRDEDGEIYLRELGFGLNPGISRQKTLSDVNSYERIAGFHVSLGKKHGIYRKKFHRKVTQRYHIDIFPDVKTIWFDDLKVFENEKYLI